MVLVTFDPHPARVLWPPRDTAALSTVDRRTELGRSLGVDAVLVLPFTRRSAALSPARGTPDGRLAHLIVSSGSVVVAGPDGPAVLEFIDRQGEHQ
ncbi:hypothetical protein [Lentzea flava]|uniref:FAD synthase n=1 Tax=Lentzea flava TaxID=103732 RepID=A0ABQ2UG15_9PSEU|nr:hypothetical protein [Lentzea flava]MCP2197989.1 FAD synthetase [Lentzea flava]GGU23888.1 hypothetical protein GCM10010178_15090 [Lentzea flava]